jgi:lysophospholipase L1-like esterase
MRSLPADQIEALLDGQVSVRRRGEAVQPLRLPVGELGFYDPFTRWVASTPAGVRLRLVTESRTLRLTTTQRLMAEADGAERRGAYDLFIVGQLAQRQWPQGGATMTGDGALAGDEAAVVIFQDLPPGEKQIELWLPQAGTVSITGLELDDDAQAAPWPDTRPTVLFHGSSITHCMEAEGASAGWPAVAAELAGVRHINLGWAGSCLISGLAARIIRDTPADAIVLKLGINVHGGGTLKERTFLDSAHAMISIIRERHERTPLLVISPIYSPGREDQGEAGGLSLIQMRSLLEDVVAARVKAGDGAISYMSGLDLFGEADAPDLPDDLHPNTAGYRRMGERFHALKLSGAGALLRG